MDLKQGNWGQTEQMKLESKYRIGGSCESIFSQASIQSPGWTILKSSKSQDAIICSPSCSQNQTWSDQENEFGSPEIVDDVVGDEMNFRSSWQQVEDKKTDCQPNLSKASYSISQMGNSNSKMSISEFLPEHSITNDERLQYFLQETETYQRNKEPGPNLVSSEEVDSENSQAAESNGSPKISVSLLKSILMEREFKINDLDKEIRKLQNENLHLLEERQSLLSECDRLKQDMKAMAFDEKRKERDLFLSYDPCSPLVLQKEISNLKNQINDLQEANESAILELAKADEEISQQRKDFSKLKAEYTQKLEESQEEIKILTEKINQPSSIISHPENYQEGLQKEISQLRSECRRLRTQSHQLCEENYLLKEDLWDLKMRNDCLLERKHVLTLENDWSEKDNLNAPLMKTNISLEWHTKDQSLSRNDAFKVDGTFSKCKAALRSMNIKEPWESKHEERFKHNASPFSMDSESTEVLIMASEDGFHKPAQTHVLGEDTHEPSDEALCSVNQSRNIHPISPQTKKTFDTPTVKISSITRPYLPVLPRRPFAPKKVADLNLGDLIKFSRPGGKISKGTIQYKGLLPGREEMYLGVELEGDVLGKHDGMFQGARYFLCKPNKGVFVNFSKVIMAWN
ncbi:uncharacterized protein LOC130357418 [Hyla sarda]|uniref:uncharacterized protein LOC130357418 n=1 Tax=Hyla sarda TaxID=327740 RepID=UPI0024C25721|nr:uncharacterized protein LOC130357418 [Hyla sarda]